MFWSSVFEQVWVRDKQDSASDCECCQSLADYISILLDTILPECRNCNFDYDQI